MTKIKTDLNVLFLTIIALSGLIAMDAYSSESSTDLHSPTSSADMHAPTDASGYLTPDQAALLLSATAHRLRPYTNEDAEFSRLIHLLRLVQQRLEETGYECQFDEELSVHLPPLLQSIARNFGPRLQNVSRFKKFLASSGVVEVLERAVDDLEEYALYLASARLAADRTSFEIHAPRYKVPRSCTSSPSARGSTSSRQPAPPSSRPRVRFGPHDSLTSRQAPIRRRVDSVENYRMPDLAELYVDPDWV